MIKGIHDCIEFELLPDYLYAEDSAQKVPIQINNSSRASAKGKLIHMLSSPVARVPPEKPEPDVDDTGEPVLDLSNCVEESNSQEVPQSETDRMKDEEQGPDSKALEKNDGDSSKLPKRRYFSLALISE